jgi:hypothetical protein
VFHALRCLDLFPCEKRDLKDVDLLVSVLEDSDSAPPRGSYQETAGSGAEPQQGRGCLPRDSSRPLSGRRSLDHVGWASTCGAVPSIAGGDCIETTISAPCGCPVILVRQPYYLICGEVVTKET